MSGRLGCEHKVEEALKENHCFNACHMSVHVSAAHQEQAEREQRELKQQLERQSGR